MAKSPPNDPKLRSLQQQGTLNPRPQAVTDERFANSEFFDARDLVQVKYEMLRRVHKEDPFYFRRCGCLRILASVVLSGPIRVRARRSSRPGATEARPQGSSQAHRGNRGFSSASTAKQNPSLRTSQLVALVKQRFQLIVHPRFPR